MSLYSKARKHIDMNRVKELRKEEIKEQKIAEVKEQQEEILVERKKITMKADPKFSNWRRDLENMDVIEEGMTSSGMFVTSTLDPAGDSTQVDIDTDSVRYNIANSVVADGAIRFGEVEPQGYNSNHWTQKAGTNYIATTDEPGTQKSTHVTFNVDVGTGIDAPLPEHPLTIKYQMQYQGFNAGTGTLGTISSSGTHSFELPPFHEFYEISFDLDVEGTYLQQYEAAYQRRQFVGTTIYGMAVTQDDTIDSLAPGRMLRLILDHPGPFDDDANTSVTVLLAHTRTNGRTVYQDMNTMPSGETGGHTLSDRQYLYNLIRSQYAHLKDRYAKTFTVNSIGLTRRTPITVFTPLDSPDSSSFVRDGDFDRLTPEQKKKKLEEQLAASKEYLNKMFGDGMPGTATEIADIELQKSFVDMASDARNPMGTGDQAAAAAALLASPMVQAAAAKGLAALAALVGSMGLAKQIMNQIDQGGEGSLNLDDYENPYKKQQGEREAEKMADLEGEIEKKEAGQSERETQEKEEAEQKRKDAEKEVKEAEASGNEDRIDRAHRNYQNAVKNKQRVNNKWKNQKKLPGYKGESFNTKGEVIKEKKTFKDLTKKIPGYYDGKPSPLGFPVEDPPKMVNGYHPDLVDGKKVSQRFNRLDPISARAMPKTGNPHIDKKVRAAAKKPK